MKQLRFCLLVEVGDIKKYPGAREQAGTPREVTGGLGLCKWSCSGYTAALRFCAN